MSKAYPVRSFKSGNSVAIRMAAALGSQPDGDWTVQQVDGKLVLTAKPKPMQKQDVDAFWGKASHMTYLPEPREDFDPGPSSLAGKR